MAEADINVWILTGDHSQVAENIAMKINLINVNFDTIHRTFDLSNEEISDLLTLKMTNKDVIIFDQSVFFKLEPRGADNFRTRQKCLHPNIKDPSKTREYLKNLSLIIFYCRDVFRFGYFFCF